MLKIYLAFKHICRTRNELTKMLHTMLYGPPAVGKSKAIDFAALMTPPGIMFEATHKSAMRNYVKLASADQSSCQVLVNDEVKADEMGLSDPGAGKQRHATNSTHERATEYKSSLTKRRLLSQVLGSTKDAVRQNEQYNVNNDIVNFQLMNNWPRLAPAMLSRFQTCCFYKFDREDGPDAKARVMDDERQQFADSFTGMQRIMYVLQMKLDTMQATGILVPVASEGFKIMAAEFETALNEYFPFAISDRLAMTRKLEDAFEYVRMMANWYAVYVTVMHPRSKHINLSTITMDTFRVMERHTCPSDELCILALSMLEPDIFPMGEVICLKALMSMVTSYHVKERSTEGMQPIGLSLELGSAQTRSWRTASNGFAGFRYTI